MRALTQIKMLVTALALLAALLPFEASASKAETAYSQARADYLKLRGDEKLRKFRHHWLNAQKKLEKAAQGLGAAELGAEAYFTLGELDSDLSRFSGQREDLESAEAAFEKVVAQWPKHRLADDAALQRAKLLEQSGEIAAARRALESAPEGDRKKEIAALLQKLPAAHAEKKVARGDEDSEHDAKAKKTAARDEDSGAKAKKAAAHDEESDAKAKQTSGRDEESDAKAKKVAARDEDSGAKAKQTSGRDEESGAKAKQTSGRDEESDAKAKKTAARDDESDAKPKKSASQDAEPKPKTSAAHDAKPGTADKSSVDKLLASAKSLIGPPAPKPAPEAVAPATAKKHGDDVERLDSDDRNAMGEAIRKAILTRDGRRVAPEESRPTALPHREPERLAEEDDDTPSGGLHIPRLSELQERLRDVRVGPPAKEAKLDDAHTRSRLKQIVKDGAQSELTLAEQLGLKMRRVIIDAGHGGHDTGAIGPSGVQEKDVALAIALKTAKKLSDAGLEVVLTRDDDTFVRLEDRSKIANQQRGDLFVSIHCNAAPSRGLRGVETYSLNTSSDRYSVRLAARENATAERGVSDLQLILADLATKANTTESQRLASRVQRSMVGSLSDRNKGLRDLGTKEALFYVLLGAKMPSILVETSFISNPDEEKLLDSEGYQSGVAQAIADAVQGYVSDRDEKLAKIE